MKFHANWRTYNTRYGFGLTIFIGMLVFMIIRPISAGKGFMFFEMFHGIFLKDIKISLIFIGICLQAQMIGYFIARDYSKSLEILNDKVIFNLFNGKNIELKFSEINSIKFTNDMYKNFEFVLIDGKKKVIYATLKNSHEILEILQKKISNTN